MIRNKQGETCTSSLRRSPRKRQENKAPDSQPSIFNNVPQLSASSQQRASPLKKQSVSPSRRALKPVQENFRLDSYGHAPKLNPFSNPPALENLPPTTIVIDDDDSEDDPISLIQSKPQNGSSKQTSLRLDKAPTSAMSRITLAAKRNTRATTGRTRTRTNPYVLREAHCEDLNESSGTEGEDEETDLSGFIVDDNAELSFHDSGNEKDSASESDRPARKPRRRVERTEKPVGRRLVRGRKEVLDSDDEDASDKQLCNALDTMNLGRKRLEDNENEHRKKTLEIIDLTSSPVQDQSEQTRTVTRNDSSEQLSHITDTVLDSALNIDFVPKLQPSVKAPPQLIPSKFPYVTSNSETTRTSVSRTSDRSQTPPATPPRSPSKTKLKSPTKLLSPSKTKAEAPRSPHRQSMDAFWDHNVINQWTDTFSPKKALLVSPRKNYLSKFTLWANDDLDNDSDPEHSQSSGDAQIHSDRIDDSSDSLPSPSESPSKTRSPSKASLLKAEQNRLRPEKKARLALKKQFDEDKVVMARNLVTALDKYVTDSKISLMAQSTGGIRVVWSKTLRSTAGRANWKRTVTKPSGSPVKGNPDNQTIEKQPGIVVQHFADIELADKIIDRPERLVNTLAHEFCHLANFMISGVRDQPHGESFKKWGKKVTTWLSSPAADKAYGWRQEWTLAEVTTKHSYVVETKYLWACIGRPADRQKQTLTMKMLNVESEDEEGCGAEYGRHSKSIDVEKQRCGRCKGFLVQVRPTPRAAPASPRKSPVKRVGKGMTGADNRGDKLSIESLEDLLHAVELSD